MALPIQLMEVLDRLYLKEASRATGSGRDVIYYCIGLVYFGITLAMTWHFPAHVPDHNGDAMQDFSSTSGRHSQPFTMCQLVQTH